MNIRSFHHPDISLPVVRRRVGQEILQLMSITGDALATSGRSLTWYRSFPTRYAYNSAVHRLRRAGVIAYRREQAKSPVLIVTDKGKALLPDTCRGGTLWKKKWNGIWYVLVYDVPEEERPYRQALRAFLKKMRMGCLQRSVWVTPHDIRPQYDDLNEAGAVDEYAFLFESRTVLGRSARDVVHSAWNMDRLARIQEWCCEVLSDNLERVLSGGLSQTTLATLAREAMSAYLSAMDEDPLLPRDLWPKGYSGRRVRNLHRRLQTEIAKRL